MFFKLYHKNEINIKIKCVADIANNIDTLVIKIYYYS